VTVALVPATPQALPMQDVLAATAVLDARQSGRILELTRLMRYYDGIHDLPEPPDSVREEFRNLQARAQSPWMRLVVDAAAERLRVDGFRTSDMKAAVRTASAQTAEEIDEGDTVAWDWWQANSLDAVSLLVHTEAIKLGIAYVSVFPGIDGTPRIRGEHPCQLYVQYSTENPSVALRAMKRWIDDDGYLCQNLYTADYIYRLSSPYPVPYYDGQTWSRYSTGGPWEPRMAPGDETWPAENPMAPVVPFVAFRNKPTLDGGYSSDIAPVLPIQDRINMSLFHRALAAEYSAFRQKWVTGIDIPVDPETREPVQPFRAAVSRIFVAPDKDTKFGEFGESDLRGYTSSIESDVQHLAAITRTPPHYLLGQSGAFPSGESLKSTETGLMARVHDKQAFFGEAWEQVIRYAGHAAGDEARANDLGAEVIWANTESRTQTELANALKILGDVLKVPPEMLQEMYGFTPAQRQRARRLAAANPSEVVQLASALRGTTPSSAATEEAAP
jgi:hypothetical protein